MPHPTVSVPEATEGSTGAARRSRSAAVGAHERHESGRKVKVGLVEEETGKSNPDAVEEDEVDEEEDEIGCSEVFHSAEHLGNKENKHSVELACAENSLKKLSL